MKEILKEILTSSGGRYIVSKHMTGMHSCSERLSYAEINLLVKFSCLIEKDKFLQSFAIKNPEDKLF